MTRAELLRELTKIELRLLSSRNIEDLTTLRELRTLLGGDALTAEDLDLLAIAVEEKLEPPRERR